MGRLGVMAKTNGMLVCARVVGMALALFTMGCGAVTSRMTFQGFGEADMERDQAIVERFAQSRDAEEPHAEVKVLLDTIPEGITTDEGSFSVEEDYQHEILGKFAMLPGAGDVLMVWFADYEDGWRKGLCYWQVPLTWITLTLWNVVPTSYPCHTLPFRSKIAIIRDLKRAAAVAGADTVIASFIGATQDEAYGAGGIMIRIDPRLKDDMKTKPFKSKDGPQGVASR
jgi:hypothetical protein